MEINSHATTYSEFVRVCDVHSDDVGMTRESPHSGMKSKPQTGKTTLSAKWSHRSVIKKCSWRKNCGDTEGPRHRIIWKRHSPLVSWTTNQSFKQTPMLPSLSEDEHCCVLVRKLPEHWQWEQANQKQISLRHRHASDVSHRRRNVDHQVPWNLLTFLRDKKLYKLTLSCWFRKHRNIESSEKKERFRVTLSALS